jgi:hypothetical protein
MKITNQRLSSLVSIQLTQHGLAALRKSELLKLHPTFVHLQLAAIHHFSIRTIIFCGHQLLGPEVAVPSFIPHLPVGARHPSKCSRRSFADVRSSTRAPFPSIRKMLRRKVLPTTYSHHNACAVSDNDGR